MESGLRREAEIAWPPAKSSALAADAGAAPSGEGAGAGGGRAQRRDGAISPPTMLGRGQVEASLTFALDQSMFEIAHPQTQRSVGR